MINRLLCTVFKRGYISFQSKAGFATPSIRKMKLFGFIEAV